MLVPTGIGKTTITVEELIVWLHMVTAGPIIYAVPYHKLGRKIEERFAGHGLNVRTFLGRGRPDPLKRDPTKSKDDQIKMCVNPEPVAVAVKCRLPVSETCCKNGKMKCPFFDPGPKQCGYQRQKPDKDEKVDVWIVASDMLFKAQKVLGEPAAVIIDEAIWRKGLRGVEQKKEDALAVDSLRCEREIDFAKEIDQRDAYRDTLGRALMQQVRNGGVEREHLAEVFSVQQCDEIIRREWKLLPKLKLQPGMSKGALEKLDPDLIDEIVHTRRVIRVWGAVRELVGSPEIEVSGRLTLKQSNGQRVVTWRGVAQINKQFEVPTLMFDATLPALEVLQVYYPLVEVVANIKVEMPPHVRVRQVLDAPTTSRKLINAKLKDPEQHLKEMRRYIWKRWMETGKQETLVVCQEKVDRWFEGKLPAGIMVIHYNDLAGLDDYKLVRLLILIGRVAPGPEAVEALAGAMSGAQPTLVPPNPSGFTWYPQVSRSIRLRDGSGHVVDRCDWHPDAFGDDVRWLICEAELIQAFGRARGINRTVDEPLDIDIVTNVVLPVTVDEVLYWKNETPSLLFETAMTEGVMLTSRIDMVKLWPHIWPNHRAADVTLAMGVPVLPGFVPVTYQLVGPKMKRRRGWFDLTVIPDPRAWLIAHLGPLAFFACDPL